MKRFALSTILLATVLGTGNPPWEPAGWQSWLYNAEERSRAARVALANGDPILAVEAARAAWRLHPSDPRTTYNLGSALLAARDPQTAATLATAAQLAANDPGLAATALYNLGNAHLQTERWGEAAKAYRDALRHRPDATDAKRNLEWVLRRMEKEPPPAPTPPPPPPEDRAAPPPTQPEASDEPPPEETPSPVPPPPFQQQGDLSAQEAEEILAAVEDLERKQQQQERRPPPPSPSPEVKDW